MFIHSVYFWLKKDAPSTAQAQVLADARSLLSKIPSVKHLWSGKPAMIARDVVDNTYDVGLTIIFDDAAGHDAYQPHELHKEFVARNKANWLRVQIYDFAE